MKDAGRTVESQWMYWGLMGAVGVIVVVLGAVGVIVVVLGAVGVDGAVVVDSCSADTVVVLMKVASEGCSTVQGIANQ